MAVHTTSVVTDERKLSMFRTKTTTQRVVVQLLFSFLTFAFLPNDWFTKYEIHSFENKISVQSVCKGTKRAEL